MLLIKTHNQYINTQNTTEFGNKSFRDFGAHMWGKMPEHIKSTNSLLEIKKLIKRWPGPISKRSVCKWKWGSLLNTLLVMSNIYQRRVQSPVKYLRWRFWRKKLMTKSHWKQLSRKVSPWVFDKVLNTPLVFVTLYIWKVERFSE